MFFFKKQILILMSYEILCVAATDAEARLSAFDEPGLPLAENLLINGHTVRRLVTGVGSVFTVWALKQWLVSNGPPDLIINTGIAGSFRDDIVAGDVVMPVTDCFADFGVESADGFSTAFEAGLADPEGFPFSKGVLMADSHFAARASGLIRSVHAVTVNTVSGSADTIKKLRARFNPDIETMEGAGFFYLCAREKVPFMALRAISNRIEIRDRSRWNIPLALENLEARLVEFIKML